MKGRIERKPEYPVSGLAVDIICGLGEKLERSAQLTSGREEKKT